MLSVIAFVRVSTHKQAEYGISLDAQRRQIKAFCRMEHLRIRKWVPDTDSARNEENGSVRAGFNEATELALEKDWPIIVATPDRFTRTSETYDRFRERGGRVYSTDIGFGADAVMRSKIERAEYVGNIIGRRTREGQKHAKALGKLGNPNFSSTRAKGNKVRQEYARLHLEEFQLRRERALQQGAKTDADVAKDFNESGYFTARGSKWSSDNVAKMRRRTARLNKAQMLIEPRPPRKPFPMFTPDGRLTSEGLRRFLDALAILGKEPGNLIHLNTAPLSEARKEKILTLIEEADALELKRVARDYLKDTPSATMATRIELEDRWGLF
jgi:DNA invertase Pin-like site-specific DNA recombinase